MDKQKFQLEYNLNSSAKMLFSRFSTAAGLSEWFADDVIIQDDIFIFEWEGTVQKARLIKKKDFKSIRFQWEDEELDEVYFEFRLDTDDLTKELALIITDFAEEDEIDDAKELWDSQIGELKRTLGM